MNRPEEWADYLDPSVPDPALSAAERSGLDRICAALADENVWGEPPAQLRSTLLSRVAAEVAVTDRLDSAGVHDLASNPSMPSSRRTTRTARDRRTTWYVAALGVAAAAALVVVLAWPRPQTTTFAMSGAGIAASATATAELEPRSAGLAITLQIKGLPPAPPGAYYAAWMRGPEGTVPVGTFHWHKGGIPINLWSGVTGAKYPELFITLQSEGQPPVPSDSVVLSGHIAS